MNQVPQKKLDPIQDNLVRPGLWAQHKQIPEIKKKLRAKVQKVSEYHISRGVFHEIVINSLYQNGYEKSAIFIEKLLEKEDPTLRTNQILLAKIADTLKDIEAGEATVFDLVTLAQSIKDYSKSYIWISKRLFNYAMDLTSGIRVDGGYLEAKIRYAYAEFLLEIEKYEKAIEILEVAYELAFEKKWYSLTPGKILYNEISNLLFQGYLKTAQALQPIDLKLAITLSKKALKHALEAEYKYAPAQAYLMRGKLEADNGDYKTAFSFFNKALQFAQVSQIPKDICEANLMKGLCLHKIGHNNRAMACIRRALNTSFEHSLTFYKAQSLMLMGYIEEAENNFDVAATNYVQASQQFILIKDDFQATKANCRSGYVLAQMIFDAYYELIDGASKSHDDTYLKTLVLWKEKQCPFWDEANRRYDTLDLKYGFTDEYKVDEIGLKDGEIIFSSQKPKYAGTWRKPVNIGFSKRIIGEFAKFRRQMYIYV